MRSMMSNHHAGQQFPDSRCPCSARALHPDRGADKAKRGGLSARGWHRASVDGWGAGM